MSNYYDDFGTNRKMQRVLKMREEAWTVSPSQ